MKPTINATIRVFFLSRVVRKSKCTLVSRCVKRYVLFSCSCWQAVCTLQYMTFIISIYIKYIINQTSKSLWFIGVLGCFRKWRRDKLLVISDSDVDREKLPVVVEVQASVKGAVVQGSRRLIWVEPNITFMNILSCLLLFHRGCQLEITTVENNLRTTP